jgi:uncharacterized repeat protein (TIGR01451 family)
MPAADDDMTLSRHSMLTTLKTAVLQAAVILVFVVCFGVAGISTAFATIDNTANAAGNYNGSPVVSNTVSVSVAVQTVTPGIQVSRAWGFAPGGDANTNGLVDAGDQIVYLYTVRNSGNGTLTNVTASDVHDGTGAPLVVVTPVSVTIDNGTPNDSNDNGGVNDGDWDKLGPGDTIIFASQPYTIVPGDLTAPTSADNDIDGTVTAAGNFAATTVSSTSSASVPLNIVPSLTISKVASPASNVAAGTPVTYTYRVKNTGTVPITNVTLQDTHKGVPGALVPNFNQWITVSSSTVAGNTITLLAPGDEAEFTATYVVTQNDVDTLQ